MNKEEFLLRTYFQTHPYGVGDNNLYNMFKAYAEQKIEKSQDISPTVAYFRHLVSIVGDYLKFPCEQSKMQFGQDKYNLFTDFANFTPHLTHAHKEYIHIVKTLLSNKQNSRLLDVGSGKVAPLASIKFAETFDSVSAMDKHLLSPQTLKKLGVNGIYGYFDKKSSVEDFDFVTGRTPCGAIDSIVEVCSKSNTPYFIETCACELPDNQSWRKILPEIDPNIKFYKDFAFNVDATADQVSKISNEYFLKLAYDEPCFDRGFGNSTSCPWTFESLGPSQE